MMNYSHSCMLNVAFLLTYLVKKLGMMYMM